MATTTWPSLTASDATSGAGAKTIGESLFKRDRVVEQVGNSFYTGAFTGVTQTSAAAAQITVKVPLPLWCTGGRLIKVLLRCGTVGGATVNFKIRDNASATDGTTVTGTAATDNMLESILTTGSGWGGTTRSIEVYVWRTGGTSVDVNSNNLLGNIRFADQA